MSEITRDSSDPPKETLLQHERKLLPQDVCLIILVIALGLQATISGERGGDIRAKIPMPKAGAAAR